MRAVRFRLAAAEIRCQRRQDGDIRSDLAAACLDRTAGGIAGRFNESEVTNRYEAGLVVPVPHLCHDARSDGQRELQNLKRQSMALSAAGDNVRPLRVKTKKRLRTSGSSKGRISSL